MGTGNATSTELAAKYIKTVSLVIYCVIFVIGVVGNGLVIYVTGFRMKRTVNSVWFLNLSLADFLFTAFLIFTIVSLFQDHQWYFGEFMCKLNNFVSVVNMFASVFLLAAISLDRCLTIWAVVWAQNKRTVRKAQILSAVIWLTAGICSIPYATFRKISPGNLCGYAGITRKQYWSLCIFRFVVGFLIPFLVIFICYVAIGIRAKRLQKTRRWRTIRIIFSMVFAFFICWLPFHVLILVDLKVNSLRSIVRVVSPLAVSLAFMNSCLNPVLYVFMCDEFQKKLRKSICFVLESALAEDRFSYASSHSLTSHLSRISRKSDSASPLDGKDAVTSLTFTESKAITTEGTQSTKEDVHI
ncbi:C3a anaphylatoxin chemotactic receptor-like [Odontesthes bonariensis]|uniref:C3a anaphylatoxin chemotactic receptor-like n=1 Tax=Odontesthes bonariensis TaxID=219752 RepID=UPI003F58E02C